MICQVLAEVFTIYFHEFQVVHLWLGEKLGISNIVHCAPLAESEMRLLRIILVSIRDAAGEAA